MKKRILSLLLCLVMALSLMPAVAFAADESIPITSVTVQGYESPVAGKTAGELCDLKLPEGANYTMDPNYFSEGRTCWYHLSGSTGSPMGKNDVFVNGEEYNFFIQLRAKEGYDFDHNCTCRILDKNGNEINVGASAACGDGPGILCVSNDYQTLESPEPIPITKVAITGVPTTLTVGESTAISASDVTITTVPADAADVLTIRWYNKTDDFTEDSTFKAGKKYVLGIHFQPKDGYYFEFDETLHDYTVEATFNGEEPDIAWSAYSNVTDADTDLYTRCKPITPTDIGEPPLQTPITKVAITGVPTTLTVGESTAISASDVTITTVPADAADVLTIRWYNETDDYALDSTFKAGKEYVLGIHFQPKDGYYFEFDETFDENYTGEATFNGEKPDIAWSAHSDVTHAYTDLYTHCKPITPTDIGEPTDPVKITEVHVTGMPTPVVGASTDISGITVTTVPADAYTNADIYWWNDTDGTSTDTEFKAGKEYYLCVKLSPKDGYYFEFDETFDENYTGEATFNGEAADTAWSLDFGSSNLGMYSKYMKPVAPEKITKVEVTNVPTPVVGASTAISASDVTITTEPAGAATINEIYWNTYDETFQAGKSYGLIVRFAPKPGYYFEFEDETGVGYYIGDVTFNGQPAFSAYETGSVPGELFATSQSMTTTEAPTPVTYTITVETDGNGMASANPASAAKGETVTLTATANTGYHFKEWQSNEVTVSGDTFTMPEKEVTVKAIFEQDTTPPVPTTYTVTFNMNGHGTQVAAQTVNEGAKATKPADPKASGYTFGGWYADATCSTKFDFNSAITANTTIYAKWTKNSVTPPVPTTPTRPAAPTDITAPKTGDSSNMLLWVMLLAASGAALTGTAIYSRKRKYN